MKYKKLIFQERNGIAKITLNRPKEFNALDAEGVNELMKVIDHCRVDGDIRVVIITGEGRAFCAGGDIGFFKKFLESNPSEPFRDLLKILNALIISLRRMPKPVIASINGAIGGGGMAIASACDIRICASSAKFKTGYTTVGLVGDGGWTLTVPMLIGLGRAIELMLLDSVFDAKQALDWGLVNFVVEDSKLDRFTNDIASRLARGPTKAFAIAKENINQAVLGQLEHQLELEGIGMVNASGTHDYIEGVNAFLEKREPLFKGY